MFSTNPVESAAEAGLRYVRCSSLSIRRIPRGKSFRYLGPEGTPLRDHKQLERIRKLVIPPAWKDVWICPSPNGHLQAIGRDARGRKQYRYHPRYRAVRDQAKFSRMADFGAALSTIRERVQQDLMKPGLPKEKVLATVVRLLETSFIRVGNDEYAKENASFGLTTLRDRHVRVAGSTLSFHFRGKSGLEHRIELTDRRLARIVKQCRDLPGYELFQYVDERGACCAVDSADVNRYIREISGEDFTAKDFRTWAGTLLAVRELQSVGASRTETESKRTIVEAVKTVARQLGNRPATCRKYYVHPAILEAYANGSLFSIGKRAAGDPRTPLEEDCVLAIVAAWQNAPAKAA